MEISQNVWRHIALLVAASLMVVSMGVADAWTCGTDYKDCDHNPANGCETVVKTDVKNCGDCGVCCPIYPYSSPTCSMGKCGYSCTPGWKDCDCKKENGCETDVGNDIMNCGGCGTKCKTYFYATTKCNNGQCDYTCNPGWKDCNYNWIDGCETKIDNDPNNCGGCGIQCKKPSYWGGEATCSNGKCGEQCQEGCKYSGSNRKSCVYDKDNGHDDSEGRRNGKGSGDWGNGKSSGDGKGMRRGKGGGW